MKRSKTSKGWMKEHVNDEFVQRATREGMRSRAAYKLMEIDDHDHLIHPGQTLIDLGAAPGGWSEVAAKRLAGRGRVIAVDLLEMNPLNGVDFIQGDFSDPDTLERINALIHGLADLVISDMAPNISGISLSDQARAMALAELALEFAQNRLKPDGSFLVKVFQGSGFEEFYRMLRNTFMQVHTRKPRASRDRSSELYLLGRHLKLDRPIPEAPR
ncbi:MAG: RlmE family RNA methyltransferase [Pseudomonadota bacterium]|nr:RlmE family RNA methyltransferase [Pseudomonadota bacterium]